MSLVIPIYTNLEDVGHMSDFTKESCISQHIHHISYFRDLMPNNTYFWAPIKHKDLSSYEPNSHPTTPLLEESSQAQEVWQC